jgi:hypothetical protein
MSELLSQWCRATDWQRLVGRERERKKKRERERNGGKMNLFPSARLRSTEELLLTRGRAGQAADSLGGRSGRRVAPTTAAAAATERGEADGSQRRVGRKSLSLSHCRIELGSN